MSNSAPMWHGRRIADLLDIRGPSEAGGLRATELWRIRTLLIRYGLTTADADAIVRWLPREEQPEDARIVEVLVVALDDVSERRREDW